MSRTKQFYQTAKHFQFDLAQHSETGLYLHTLVIEGYGCRKQGYYDADIDRVLLGNTDVKPLLEVNGGMPIIDRAATEYVKNMFRNQLQTAA